jgi:hypothetical protein
LRAEGEKELSHLLSVLLSTRGSPWQSGNMVGSCKGVSVSFFPLTSLQASTPEILAM